MQADFAELAGALRQELEKVPEAMRQEQVERQVIINALMTAVSQMGLTPVPAWKPPLSTRDRIDLVAVEPGSHPPVVKAAFAVDPLVELPKLKALDWVDCEDKVAVTYSRRPDKVAQTTFFLKPGMSHINLFD